MMDDMSDRRKRGKVKKVMHEFKHGTLKSGSGHMVTDHDQAMAIAMSESGQGRRKRRRRGKKA